MTMTNIRQEMEEIFAPLKNCGVDVSVEICEEDQEKIVKINLAQNKND